MKIYVKIQITFSNSLTRTLTKIDCHLVTTACLVAQYSYFANNTNIAANLRIKIQVTVDQILHIRSLKNSQ